MVNKPRKRGVPVPEPTQEESPPPVADPLDFSTLSVQDLRNYRERYGLQVPTPCTMDGFMLAGSVGERTWSGKHLHRASKQEVADAVKESFLNEPVKETDTIVNFVYGMKHKPRLSISTRRGGPVPPAGTAESLS